MSQDVGVWVAVVFTFAMISLAFFKENPVYRLGEHIFIGIGAGHAVVVGVTLIRTSGWQPLVQKGQVALIIPLVLGLLLFARYVKRYAQWAKPSMAIILASGAALGLRGTISTQFLDQIRATFVPLNDINNLLLVLGVIATLGYFFFTEMYNKVLTGPLSTVPRLGRYVMMIAFGASFASAGAGFLSKLIARIMFLARDWLGAI